VIVDGSVGSVVAAWLEAVCRAPAMGASGASPAVALWVPMDGTSRAAGGFATQMARELAEAAQCGEVIEGSCQAAEHGPAATNLLLAAGAAAMARGATRVIWPVQFEGGHDDARLTAIATAADRALLAARLLSLDADGLHGGLVIETPLLELTDAELIDLAGDIDAPIGLALREPTEATTSPTPSTASAAPAAQRQRFARLVAQAGLVGPVAKV
jgi:hypothetical protein